MLHRIALVVGFASLLLIGLVRAPEALAVKAVPPSSPASVALCLCDLQGGGFYQTWGQFFTDQREAKADRVSLGSLHSHGWIGAFDSAFVRGGRSGIVAVYDAVNSYRTYQGAHWAFQAAVASLVRDKWLYRRLNRVPVGAVGDERLGYVFSQEYYQIPVTATVTLFHRRSYVAKLVVLGGPDDFLPGQALRLAHVIDQRMLNGK
jgi:hypothetical protein